MNSGEADSSSSLDRFPVSLRGVEGGKTSPLEVRERICLRGEVSKALKEVGLVKLDTGEDCAMTGMLFVKLLSVDKALLWDASDSGASESV